MQIFCLFFCVLCELGGKITARNAKVTQSTQVCLSKTSRPLNKSTFYIRLTALRRSGYSFFPNASLRYTLGWINAPLRSCYSGQPSVPHSSLEGGKGDVHIGVITGEHRGLPLHELPFPLPCHSEHFPCHSERQRWIFPLPRGIPHGVRNDRGTCCRDAMICVSTVRTAFICEICVRTPCTLYITITRKGWKPDIFQPHPVRVGSRPTLFGRL